MESSVELSNKCASARHDIEAGSLASAAELYREVLSADPDHLDAVLGLADVQRQRGVLLTAARLYAKARRMKPDNEDIITRHVELAEELLGEVRSLMFSGNLHLANERLLLLLSAYERWDDVGMRDAAVILQKEDLTDAFVAEGTAYLKASKKSDALYCFRKALMNNPEHEAARAHLDEVTEELLNAPPSRPEEPATPSENDFQKISLSDLGNISREEFERARAIAEQFRTLVDDRHRYITQNGLDEQIWSPDAMWKNRNNDAILNPEYDIINHLRLHASFTGNNLSKVLDPASTLRRSHLEQFLSLVRDQPPKLVVKPPRMAGELGWQRGPVLLNEDMIGYQERLTLLCQSGIIESLQSRKPLRILDIGGGFGALAYFLKTALPEASIYLCDLPEFLASAAVYLSLVMPKKPHTIFDAGDPATLQENGGFIFLPNYAYKELASARFDLVINTLSFSEMSTEQVRSYAEQAKTMIGEGGFLFEQNQDNRHVGGIHAQEIIGEVFSKRIFQERFLQGFANVWVNG